MKRLLTVLFLLTACPVEQKPSTPPPNTEITCYSGGVVIFHDKGGRAYNLNESFLYRRADGQRIYIYNAACVER
jgi:hypothetical protein